MPTLKVFNDTELSAGARLNSENLMDPFLNMINVTKKQNKSYGRDSTVMRSQGRRLITPLSNPLARNGKGGAPSEQSASIANDFVDDLIHSAVSTYFLSRNFDAVSACL